MNNFSMYCLSGNDEDYKKIKSLGYIPVGLGNGIINTSLGIGTSS